MFSFLQEVLNYPTNNRSKTLEKKSIMDRSGELNSLTLRLKQIIHPDSDFINDINIIFLLNSLPTELDSKKESILNIENITIDRAVALLAGAEQKILIKRKSEVLDPIIMSVKSQKEGEKRDTRTCYIYGKIRHIASNY